MEMRREFISLVLLLALLPCAITGPFTWNPFSDDSRPLVSEGEVSCSSDDGACKRGDTGGWSTDADTILSSSRCNIRKIYKSWQSGGISAEEFRKYYEKEPVIIVGGRDNGDCRNLCRKEALLQEYGQHPVILSRHKHSPRKALTKIVSSANTFSHAKLTVTLEEYASRYMLPQHADAPADNSWYLFGDNDHNEWKDVFSAYRQPEYFLPHERLSGRTASLSFGIGSSGTGVPFHVHGPGFSEVLWGRKRWFLTHRDDKPDFSPDNTTLMWLQTRYYGIVKGDFRNRLFECTIGPGEALYFPDHWWHATLNIGETVFMSTFT